MIESPELQRVLFRFLMDLVRAMRRVRRENAPPRLDRLLVLASVSLGTLEGRPFRVQKLAEYVGMPRTSVLRRLGELGQEGWIEYDDKGHVLARADRLNEPVMSEVCGRMSTLIHRAHYELLEIERKENKNDQTGH